MEYNKKIVTWSHKSEIQLYKFPIIISKANNNASSKREIIPRKKYSEMNEQEKKKSDERREQYFQKRTAYLADICVHNKLNTFITLTFKENITDYGTAKHQWELFLKRLKYHIRNEFEKEIKYVAVHELQRRRGDVFHFHFLCDIGFYPVERLQKLWGKGYVYINKININAPAQIRYLFKYISKDILVEQNNQKRNSARKIYTSRNLDKPTITTSYTTETIEDLSFEYMESISNAYSYDVINHVGEKINEVDVLQIDTKD